MGENRTPHLSTLDVIQLSIRTTYSSLNTINFDPHSNFSYRMDYYSIKASEIPVEDLNNILIDLTFNVTIDGLYTFTGSINGMKIKMKVQKTNIPNNTELPDYYNNGFQDISYNLENVRINVEAGHAVAKVSPSKNIKFGGLDINTYEENIPFAANAVVFAELSQAYMLKLDNLTRNETDTLWMRKIEFNRSKNYKKELNIYLDKTNTLVKNNNKWRLTKMHGILGNIEIKYSLAHVLPTKGE